MLFHLGALWRLNELGFLPRLDRVSSVSGGSITAATLGRQWARLDFDADGVARGFVPEVVTPLRRLASTTVDSPAFLGGILRPRRSAADLVIKAYRKHLFGDATLQDLPDRPRFVLTATNLQVGSLWRFAKGYMADYRIGTYPAPHVELAVAVGASAAVPPVLSPVRLTVDANGYAPDTRGDLFRPPFNTDPALTDGSIADNLALETAWKRYATILVSDAGGRVPPDDVVHSDWARQAVRVTSLIDSHLRNLRRRQTIEAFKDGTRTGAYWGIHSDIAAYGLDTVLPCPDTSTRTLAATTTRLARMPDDLQERLINWGYAVCDAAIRAHVERTAPPPQDFPYPASGVG
jgi:NTE family protein